MAPVRSIALAPGDADPLERLLDAPAWECAPLLLGWTLLTDGIGGRIVEVEAYDGDEASHAYKGQTPRNRSMFGKAGLAYVYRSYGLHWCLNAVSGPVGHGAAVLIRALEPTHGIDQMCERRNTHDLGSLCSGPGKLTQALGIDVSYDGCRLDRPPFALEPPTAAVTWKATPRVGISRAVELPRRFVESPSRWASRGPRPD